MSLPTIEAVVREVWAHEISRYADVQLLHHPEPAALARRTQGDIHLTTRAPVERIDLANPGALLTEMDRAFQVAITALRPITNSEAIEAAERRRLYTR